MQMKNREYVEGSDPAVYIGHRIHRSGDGQVTQSKVYHAEYTLESRQRSKSLRTTNKNAAIRAVHALCEQLRQGIEEKPFKKVSVPVSFEFISDEAHIHLNSSSLNTLRRLRMQIPHANCQIERC